ncbi:MAG: hypothetical protein AAF772_10235 [Acidobacteriota bacterium]
MSLRRGGWRRWRVLVVAALMLMMAAAPLHANARESYRNGVTAYEAGRFADAVRWLQQAIAERPEARAANLIRSAYMPHYHLGLALAGAGDCRAALRAWQTAESQGVVRRAPAEYAELRRQRERCQSKIQALDALRQRAQADLDQAGRSADALDGLRRSAELGPVWQQTFAGRYSDAREMLAKAGRALSRAENDAAIRKAEAMAQRAADEMQQLLQDATQRRDVRRRATADAIGTLREIESRGRALLARLASLAPYPPGLAQRVTTVEEQLARVAELAKPNAPLSQLMNGVEALESAIERLEKAGTAPPLPLRRAAESYLRGDYAAVLETLTDLRYSTWRARSQICLLRAAAGYALWTLELRQDTDRAAQVADDIRLCGELEPAVEPDPRYFSPAFVAYYAQVLDPSSAPLVPLDAPAADDGFDPAADDADVAATRADDLVPASDVDAESAAADEAAADAGGVRGPRP